MPPKILIACEESQTVCKAFRDRGFEVAYSCDIQEPSGGGTQSGTYWETHLFRCEVGL